MYALIIPTITAGIALKIKNLKMLKNICFLSKVMLREQDLKARTTNIAWPKGWITRAHEKILNSLYIKTQYASTISAERNIKKDCCLKIKFWSENILRRKTMDVKRGVANTNRNIKIWTAGKPRISVREAILKP